MSCQLTSASRKSYPVFYFELLELSPRFRSARATVKKSFLPGWDFFGSWSSVTAFIVYEVMGGVDGFRFAAPILRDCGSQQPKP